MSAGLASGMMTFQMMRSLDDAGVHFLGGGLDHARHIRGGGDDERHDHGAVAEAGADDGLCHRQHGDHEDDERDAAQGVDDDAERAVEPADGVDAVAVGHAQDEADRQADEIGKERGDERHVNGLPDTELQDAVLPELDEQIRHDFHPPVDKRCGYGRASAAHRGTAAGRRAGR